MAARRRFVECAGGDDISLLLLVLNFFNIATLPDVHIERIGPNMCVICSTHRNIH
jgi:hypothetical protein